MKENTIIPLSLALVLTILIILVVPLEFNRYTIDRNRAWNHLKEEFITFADLNGDGIEDMIDCGGRQDNYRRSACTCRTMDETSLNGTLDQLNVPNLLEGSFQAETSDFDKDGFAEIWIPSAKNDQLYLYGFEADDLSRHKYRFWLDSIYPQAGKYVASFGLRYSIDLNQDKQDELFFIVGNRFPIYPRRAYRVDVANHEIVRSPVTSAGFFMDDVSKDREGNFIFTSSTSSPGNHEDFLDFPYPDTLGYIYAFDQYLNFLFDPIPFSEYPSATKNCFLNNKLLSFKTHRTLDSTLVVQYRSLDGRLLKERKFRDLKFYCRKSENEFILGNATEITVIDSLFEITRVIPLNERISTLNALDLDEDGKMELLALAEGFDKYLVYDNNLNFATEFRNESGRTFTFATREYAPGSTEFSLFGEGKLLFYRYEENPYYYFRFPYYLVVFLVALFLSSVTFRYYRKNIEQRFEQEREFNRLQILSLKNQIDPHFALNALNSIDWMYKREDHEKASKFMGTYARLVHQTVKNSDKISVSLYEELSFCRKFCDLEQMREDEFSYAIDVAEEVDPFEVEVPRQLLFTHVENAVKHGLRPKEGGKRLGLKIARRGRDVSITISNNGIPYQKKSSTSGTGKGLEIHRQLIDIYRSLKNVEIATEIGPCANGTGTCIQIILQDVFAGQPTHK
mgnify:CR=1 FL=1